MSLLLRPLCTGHPAPDPVDKNAEAVFKTADYYGVTNLK